MSGANLTILQDGHAIDTSQKSFPLANISLPLLIAISRGQTQPCQHFHMPCNVQKSN